MTELSHPILGEIDLTTAGDWHGERQYADGPVTVELTIDAVGLSGEAVSAILKRSDDLNSLDAIARAALLTNAGGGDEASVVLYMDHHRDELPDEALNRIFGTADREKLLDAGTFLSRLKLVRVGIHPANEEAQILLDYTLDAELTDYLLCVSFSSSGAVTAVYWET